MTQTLKTLINTVAAEVYELQDTKADRIELHAYIRTVNPENTGIDSSGNKSSCLVISLFCKSGIHFHLVGKQLLFIG